jgi:hypothetical protein
MDNHHKYVHILKVNIAYKLTVTNGKLWNAPDKHNTAYKSKTPQNHTYTNATLIFFLAKDETRESEHRITAFIY